MEATLWQEPTALYLVFPHIHKANGIKTIQNLPEPWSFTITMRDRKSDFESRRSMILKSKSVFDL